MISLKEVKPLEERLTKRRQIYRSLERHIRSQKMPAGSSFPTTQQLGKHFSVSYATIQAALDDLVRDGWLVRHQGKGTFTTDRREQKQRPVSCRLVVVLPVQEDIEAAGSATEMFQILHGQAGGASECGSHVEILSLPTTLNPGDIESAVQTAETYDGALFVGMQYAPLIKELGRCGKQLVTIAGDPALGTTVWYDRAGATRTSVEHLLEHGHRRIAYFGAMQGDGGVKYTYFCQTLREHGIEHDTARSYDCTQPYDAYAAAQQLLSRAPLPEAVFVDNYQKAMILVQVAQSRGLNVPKDLAVMAYGTAMPGTAMPLSYMAVPYAEMGRQAAIVLDQLIRGRAVPPIEKVLKAKLIVRESCGCKLSEVVGSSKSNAN